MSESDDRPLTDAQERALIRLADHADTYGPETWWGDGRPNTLDALRRRGYVETRERPSATVARITDAGRALLRGMGD